MAALFIFFLHFGAFAQVLTLTLSDSHSNYANLPKFLNRLAQEVETFHHAHPRGQVVLLINGDFGGTSGLASIKINGVVEGGEIGNDALAQLAGAGVKIFFNSGNHEAHDFAGTNKHNRLYVEQMKRLAGSSPNVYLLGTNTVFTDASGLNQVFGRYHDFVDGLAGRNRVLGLTLEGLETKSSLFRPDPLYERIESYAGALDREIINAIGHGVDKMTIMIHDGTPVVQRLADQLEKKYDGRMRFNVWLAAHDHVHAVTKTLAGTPVFNAGSQFGYLRWLDTDVANEPKNVTSFKMEEYENFRSRSKQLFRAPLAHAIATLEENVSKKVHDLKQGLRQNKYGRAVIPHGKLDMKKAERLTLGLALADAIKDWGRQNVRSSFRDRTIVGIYNTSSYRLDRGLGDIQITDLELLEMAPFSMVAKIHELNGAELLEIIRTTVIFQKNLGAIQLSRNLRVVYTEEKSIANQSALKVPVRLEILESNHDWRELKPNEKIVTAIDGWTAKNGYGFKYVGRLQSLLHEDHADLAREGTISDMPEVVRQFLPRNLIGYSGQSVSPELLPIKNAPAGKTAPQKLFLGTNVKNHKTIKAACAHLF